MQLSGLQTGDPHTEPEVLAGAGGILPRVEFVAVDVGPERGASRQTTLVDVFNMLYDKGFVLVSENMKKNTFLFRQHRT
jgi:hypothetical protein